MKKVEFKKIYKLINTAPTNIYGEKFVETERYNNECCSIKRLLTWFYVNKYDVESIIERIAELEVYNLSEFKVVLSKQDFETYNIGFEEFLEQENKNLFKKIDPRSYGEYYTSIELSSKLLDMIELPKSIKKTVDPSIGSGFLLNEYLKKQRELILSFDDVKDIAEKLYGFDIFYYAIITSKLLIGSNLFELFKSYDAFSLPNIKLQNTLEHFFKYLEKEKYDFIIGNPPYFRIDPKEQIEVYRSKTSFGHSYAHSMFLEWTIDSLTDSGSFALILPESILSGYYYKRLRGYLINNISHIELLLGKTNMENFNVQQEIMMVYGNQTESSVYVHNIDSNSKFKIEDSIIINKNYVIPTITEEEELILLKQFARKMSRIDLSKIKVGTGNFVWNQNKKLLGNKISKENSYPLITSKNIVDGNLTLDQSDYIIAPEKKYIKNQNMIIFRRMSPIDYEKRFMSTIIEKNSIKGWILENHVNYITCDDIEVLIELQEILLTQEFNKIINIFCHTNQVSSNDILIILEIIANITKEGLKDEQIKLF